MMIAIKHTENNCLFEDQKVQECDATKVEKSFAAGSIKKISLFFFSFCIFMPLYAQQTITLHFENFVGDKLLNTDSTYSNTFGETFTIRNFQYYISNIELVNA